MPNFTITVDGVETTVCGADSIEHAYALHAEAMDPPLSAQDYARAVQEHVDATARGRGYDSGVSLASYVASTITSWAAEAAAFVAWRDAVWAYAYMELAKVQNAERAQPTVAELVAELPVIAWPA
jgi:uncharacterized membrane protein YgcG